MTRIERVTSIPQSVVEQLLPYSRTEFEAAGEFSQRLVAKSEEVWIAFEDEKPLLVVGVLKHGLLGGAEVWFLLCEHFRLCHVRRSRHFFRNMLTRYRFLRTDIEDVFKVGIHFARFFGFERTPLELNVAGRNYHIYEARS